MSTGDTSPPPSVDDTNTGNTADALSPAKQLYIGALGVVFGDIGTSPIYAFREALSGASGSVNSAFILGILSLIVWSLILVISVKYLLFVLRADNHGEGGIVALVALLSAKEKQGSVWVRRALIGLGLFGACLLYGDGTITPAISVLSAVEGLNVVSPHFDDWVIPITIAILVGLFSLQRNGSGTIGKWFGVVMLLWFVVLAAMGIVGISQHPQVLQALNPLFALHFLADNGTLGFMTLGAVFLVITGGEALYADLGHFGPNPIRWAWFTLVFPALLLNYFGQAALLIANPGTASSPFFHLVPDWLTLPLVLLATCATVIASQAVVSGTFSLTRQAIQLGKLPRMRIIYTDTEESGQIYIPAINFLLMVICIGLVLGFKSSDAMASAYGVAVSLDMMITTLLAMCVAVSFGWFPKLAIAAGCVCLCVDAAFLGANAIKIPQGGWYALVLAALVFMIMLTWSAGRRLLASRLSTQHRDIGECLHKLRSPTIKRIAGTAVVLTGDNHNVLPAALVHHINCTGVLHERVILLTIETLNQPRVPAAERLLYEELDCGLMRLTVQFGFSQATNIPVALKLADKLGLPLEMDKLVYLISRETLIPRRDLPGMPYWQELLFVMLSRNVGRATAYYHLPEQQVLELGIQVAL